ncbi:hypothetical protein STEG23_032570 [Scotinomys teguina]
MGYRVKQRIYGRRISNGRKTFKEMLNILSHQRNDNQNNSEIPSYTCQNGLRSSQSPSEEEPQSLPRIQEQPVTLGRRGPKSNQSPLEKEDPGAASHPQKKRTQEQPVILEGRRPRNSQSPSEEEDPGAPRHHHNKRPPLSLIQGRNGKTSIQKYIQQRKKQDITSPPPTPRPEHCNVDKAEENDLKNSLMKMIEEALEGKMKNAIK